MRRAVPHIARNNGNQHSFAAKWRLNELGLKVAKHFQMTKIQVSIFLQEISLKKIFGGSQILTINATKFAGLDEGATPLGPYSATRGFTW